MGSCYSGVHFAETIYKQTKQYVSWRNDNRSTALERSVIYYSGIKLVLQDPNSVVADKKSPVSLSPSRFFL